MTPIITLTTDFGSTDPFVGIMKGVILSTAPHARLVDLTHEISPGNILAAALTIEAAIPYFPEGTIHLAVVDPGVGTTRKPIAIQHNNQYFVGPDNGLFSLILNNNNDNQKSSEQSSQSTRIIHLTNDTYFRKPVSPTFHGRDIFAPVAGHLALGTDINQLGTPITNMQTLNIPTLILHNNNTITAQVIAIDHFGNLITNCKREDLPPHQPDQITITVNLPEDSLYCTNNPDSPDPLIIPRLSRTFAEVNHEEPLAYFGSTGRLEIAIRDANAAQQFALKPGANIHITISNTEISS